jgi:hypothetical protein
MAHLFGSDSLGHSLQAKIPEVIGLLRSLRDLALVEMFIKAFIQMHGESLNSPPDESSAQWNNTKILDCRPGNWPISKARVLLHD